MYICIANHKNVLGYILGDFFTNASGRPVREVLRVFLFLSQSILSQVVAASGNSFSVSVVTSGNSYSVSVVTSATTVFPFPL
jgi:hypothetical protein